LKDQEYGKQKNNEINGILQPAEFSAGTKTQAIQLQKKM